MDIFIGIDFGTSGCRAIAIDDQGQVHGQATLTLPRPQQRGREILQEPQIWLDSLHTLLDDLLRQVDPARVRALAIDGTSATLLPLDSNNQPLGPARLYNDSSNETAARLIADQAPADNPARGSSSSLAKALGFIGQYADSLAAIAHQADWLVTQLGDMATVSSDENNALKLGYDPALRQWPEWIRHTGLPSSLLPRAVPPGTILGNVHPDVARQTGLNRQCLVVAGTTDSTAAFLATGASKPGEAVTSLGSTLVLKIISEKPVSAARHGIYSHRLGDLWIAGGASNTGGAVLRQFFDDEQMRRMSEQLDPDHPSGLDYYPLPSTGERFPIADPTLEPRLAPRPDDDLVFFQGLLEGLTTIEKLGYQRLAEAGSPAPTTVYSVGGGSGNEAWRRMREKALGIPVVTARHSEAAYGTALLAMRGATRQALSGAD